MTPGTVALPAGDLDQRVAAFEAAWADGAADLAAFLPDRHAPDFPATLAELVRIDLEFRGSRGESPRLSAYRTLAPELFADPAWVAEVAFEEYRQRLALGEAPRPEEYAAAYGIAVADWPHEEPQTPAFPRDGEAFGPFRVVRELGRGSFGRVYLAEQTDLANRPVAVKLSTRFSRTEPETLAKLQHTHIVPIYSTHRVGAMQAIVMPFLGATTLADVLAALRAKGGWPASGQALADTVANRASRTTRSGEAQPAADRPPLHLPLEELRNLTFPDAVLWVGEKLAGALAHAHDRGVLHRDIKPANVLLTDDGQPMLLDFNLAADASREDAGVGGTPAYMAPEQLAAMTAGGAVDHRADIYSLGLVLAELLIGRSPFAAGDSRPQLSRWNPAVTPSTEAILAKCLAVNPADRYASAHELAEEFRRQLAHQPLAVTREPSLRERVRKWRRRHPRLASTGSLAAVAVVLTLGLAAAVRQVQFLTEERAAGQKYQDFQRSVPAVLDRVLFFDPKGTGPEPLLATYGVLDDDRWDDALAVRRLPEPDRRDLREQVAELLFLKSRREPDPAAALRVNAQAEAVFRRSGAIPRAVADERHKLLKALGRAAEAAEAEAQARAAAAQDRDWYYSGLAARADGDFETAARLFTTAVDRDPRHYWSWLLLGDAWTQLGRDDRAEACFTAAVALKPDVSAGHFNRGLCRLRRGDADAAVADLTAALDRNPGLDAALVARGRAHQAAGRWAEAEADFTAALDGGTPQTRPYFLRAEVRKRRGDWVGAARDYAEGKARTPTDELSWVSRGLARTDAGDYRGALADYAAALALNPRSYPALMNTANVLDERLHDEAEAVRVLGRIVALFPHQAAARAGRAVLLARRGDRAAALADAEACRRQTRDREVVYQLAGVYALTSRGVPADAAEAFALLRQALADGYGFDLLATDPDLEPVRGRPEFRALVEAARVLKPSQ